MNIFTTIIRQFEFEGDDTSCSVSLFEEEIFALKHAYKKVVNFLAKNGLSLVSDDGVKFSEDKIDEIIKEGFELDEETAEEQGFYAVEFYQDYVSVRPISPSIPTLEIFIKKTDVPNAVASKIHREVDRQYHVEDAEQALMAYTGTTDEETLYNYLCSNYADINNETDYEKLLNKIVDMYEKKSDCNIDENSTWDIACNIVLTDLK